MAFNKRQPTFRIAKLAICSLILTSCTFILPPEQDIQPIPDWLKKHIEVEVHLQLGRDTSIYPINRYGIVRYKTPL